MRPFIFSFLSKLIYFTQTSRIGTFYSVFQRFWDFRSCFGFTLRYIVVFDGALLTLTRCTLKITLTLSVQSAWLQSAKLWRKIFRILSLSSHDTPPIPSINLSPWSCTPQQFSRLSLLARSLNLISQQILAQPTGSSLYFCRSFLPITNHRVAGHFHILTWQAHGSINYSRSSLVPVSA